MLISVRWVLATNALSQGSLKTCGQSVFMWAGCLPARFQAAFCQEPSNFFHMINRAEQVFLLRFQHNQSDAVIKGIGCAA